MGQQNTTLSTDPDPTPANNMNNMTPVSPSPSPATGGVANTGAPTPAESESWAKVQAKLGLNKANAAPDIFGGPKTFGSLIKHRKKHLTYQIDRLYFHGRAGGIRIFALTIAVISFGLGLPGFNQTEILYIGYSSSFYTYVSMIFVNICIGINATFIYLLLFYSEVRYQAGWEEWNTFWHAIASLCAALSGMAELCSIFDTREKNCNVNQNYRCEHNHELDEEHDHREKEHASTLELPYRTLHYWSCFMKFFLSLLYSFASSKLIRNEAAAE